MLGYVKRIESKSNANYYYSAERHFIKEDIVEFIDKAVKVKGFDCKSINLLDYTNKNIDRNTSYSVLFKEYNKDILLEKFSQHILQVKIEGLYNKEKVEILISLLENMNLIEMKISFPKEKSRMIYDNFINELKEMF